MDHETLIGFTTLLYDAIGRLTGGAPLQGRRHAEISRHPA